MLNFGTVGTAKRARQESQPSKLRAARVRQGLTREFVAKKAGIHPNTLKLLENGTIKETSEEVVTALSSVLQLDVDELGLTIREDRPSASIRLRSLSAKQRALLNEILDLPEEKYGELRAALKRLKGKGPKA